MSILINRHTKVICQGLTGAQGGCGLEFCRVGPPLKNHTVTRILCDWR
jgi:hypothetical protein